MRVYTARKDRIEGHCTQNFWAELLHLETQAGSRAENSASEQNSEKDTKSTFQTDQDNPDIVFLPNINTCKLNLSKFV